MRAIQCSLPDQHGGFDVDRADCEEFAFDDALEFVDALSPIKSHWGSADSSFGSWIFRGQANASWALVPAAHRPGVLDSFLEQLGLRGLPAELAQQHKELLAVVHFVQHCRASAVTVPEDGQAIRLREREEEDRLWDRARSGNAPAFIEGHWPPPELASLFAIAQHHGVPTRLLDWTRSQYVAAYFAVREAAEKHPRSDGRLAVWAFDPTAVCAVGSVLSPSMVLVEAPVDTNPYLRAQRGLFTVVTNERRRTISPESEVLHSFGYVVSYAWGYLASMGTAVSAPWVRKLTLPHREADLALRLLDRFDVNAATIYPDYNGVTSALRERRFWRFA